MNTVRCLCASLALTLVLTYLHAADAVPEPKTIAEQTAYLEGALSESFRTRDLVMLDITVKGLKALKLGEKELEISILRAERNASWSNTQQYGMATVPAASIEAWGLMTRAKMGSEQALNELRKASGDLPPSPGALPAWGKVPAAEYLAKQTAQAEYGAKIRLRGQAMLALALFKEPGIQDKALAAIRKKAEIDQQGMMMMGMYGGGTDPLILAVLEPDTEGGFAKLIAYCSDEKVAMKEQAGVLTELNALLTSAKYMGADEKFSVTQAIRERLPKDGQKQLAAPFVSIVKRYAPDTKQPWDMTLNSIANIGMGLPEDSLGKDGIDALEELLKRLPGPKEQYPKQNFISILKKNGRDVNGPVKPPKPPAETGQF